MPHTNESPPDGVHGAGAGVCATATAAATTPDASAATMNCFMTCLPLSLSDCRRIVTQTIEFRNAGRQGTRHDDARHRRLRDRPGAHLRAPVGGRPGGHRLLAPRLRAADA